VLIEVQALEAIKVLWIGAHKPIVCSDERHTAGAIRVWRYEELVR
jgi:hypothetical protein